MFDIFCIAFLISNIKYTAYKNYFDFFCQNLEIFNDKKKKGKAMMLC